MWEFSDREFTRSELSVLLSQIDETGSFHRQSGIRSTCYQLKMLNTLKEFDRWCSARQICRRRIVSAGAKVNGQANMDLLPRYYMQCLSLDTRELMGLFHLPAGQCSLRNELGRLQLVQVQTPDFISPALRPPDVNLVTKIGSSCPARKKRSNRYRIHDANGLCHRIVHELDKWLVHH